MGTSIGALALVLASVSFAETPPATDDGLASLDELLATEISAAARYGQTTSEAPASVSIVTADEIERYGWRTLDEALGSIRGFYTSYDRNYSYLGTRGFGRPTDYNNRILLLIDGHPTNEPVFGSCAVGTDLAIDLGSLERIEIVRGPSSSLYGTSAMFAVINLVRKRGSSIAGARVNVEAGSFGRFGGSILAGGTTTDGLDWSISANGAKVDGDDLYFPEFDTPPETDGHVRGLDGDRWASVIASARYGGFSLLAGATDRSKEIPTAPYETVFGNPHAEAGDDRQFIDLKWESEFGTDKNWMVRAAYDGYQYEGTYPYDIDFFDGAEARSWTMETQFRWDLAPENRLVAGGESRWIVRSRYFYETATEEIYDKSSPHRVWSVFLQDEWQLGRSVSLTAGLRHDHSTLAGGATNPRAALVWNPSRETSIKLLYGEAFRAPSVFELEYEDSNSNFVANPDLDPERIRTLEASWEERFTGGVSLSLSAYDYRVRDLIDTIREDSGELHFDNVAKVEGRGIEAELGLRRDPSLALFLRWSVSRAEDAESGRRLTNSPTHLARAGIEWRPIPAVDLSGEIGWESERITVQETKTDSVFLANVRIGVAPFRFQSDDAERIGGDALRNARISFLVKNLFDEEWVTPGGFEHRQAAIPQDGRTWMLRLETRF